MSKRKSKTTMELLAGTPTLVPVDLGPVCPKCGGQDGWSGPSYRPAGKEVIKTPRYATSFSVHVIDLPECLLFTCKRCGYPRHEPCINTSHKGEE